MCEARRRRLDVTLSLNEVEMFQTVSGVNVIMSLLAVQVCLSGCNERQLNTPTEAVGHYVPPAVR